MTVAVLSWDTTIVEHRSIAVAPEDIPLLFNGVESLDHLMELASAEDKSKLLEILSEMEDGGKSSCREEIADRVVTSISSPPATEKPKKGSKK